MQRLFIYLGSIAATRTHQHTPVYAYGRDVMARARSNYSRNLDLKLFCSTRLLRRTLVRPAASAS